ncbi:ABC transporter permease subunit [Variovorax sp.]|jgi:octopine/nopaline transport system permease protein|uniref:ABC transporter permease subunit n=1 Tax=Variovorax sp. TaxID=1871043 RepID=UPI0037D9BC6D
MFDLETVRTAGPVLVRGAALTLQLTGLALLLGLVLAMPVAFAKNSAFAPLRALAEVYITVFRGTPSLVQVFLLYHGAAQFEAVRGSAWWPVLREPFWCIVIALGLNSAASIGTRLAAAFAAVPRGLVEAARGLGLDRLDRFRWVTFPLAMRAALPACGDEVIRTSKATSIASTVALLELTGSARALASPTGTPYAVFIGAAIGYLLINGVLMALSSRLARALALPLARERVSKRVIVE